MALVQLQFNLHLRLDFTEFHFKMAKQQTAVTQPRLKVVPTYKQHSPIRFAQG